MTPQNSQVGTKPRHRRSKLVVSIVLMVALIVAKTLSENVGKVREIEEGTYKRLLHLLVAAGTKTRPQILVIDIGSIEPERLEQNGVVDLITPRDPIEKLIQAFADRGARSIGVDVDFSPDNGQFVHPGDPAFFRRCLELSKKTKIPIFLGVGRTFDQPDNWLGDDAYRRLAAAIVFRKIVEHDQVPHWIRVKDGDRLRSMSAALAGVDVNANDDSHWSWAVKSTSLLKLQSGIESKETTIDYAPLPWIEAEVLPVFLDSDAYAKMEDKIKGRMVILGDRKPSDRDMFATGAGRLPGVYIHACAANTIATEPLYRLTHWGRLVTDLLLALAIFLFVKIFLFLRLLFKGAPTHGENRLNVIFTSLVIIFVLLISVVFVNWTRLLWTDFVFVCLVLLVQLATDIVRSRSKPRQRRKHTSNIKPASL
jgi:CHASE2 domain-containing sensor protein